MKLGYYIYIVYLFVWETKKINKIVDKCEITNKQINNLNYPNKQLHSD